MVDFYKKTLKNSKLLREFISEDCLNELCLIVKEQKFQPDDAIFKAGDLISRLYFILDG